MKSLNALSIAAAILVADCATPTASSAPVVTGDEWVELEDDSASQPACNRLAFEVLWIRERLDSRRHRLELLDYKSTAELAQERARAAEERAAKAGWWARNGPSVMVGGAIGAVFLMIGGVLLGHFAK